MCDMDKFVKLLSQTDGRDKIYKSLAGLLKIFAALDAAQGRATAYGTLGRSITDGRSLMRMAKWSGDIPKMRGILSHCAAKSSLPLQKMIELVRVLGNFLYVLGDNVAFLARFNLLPVKPKVLQARSKMAQFWGFFFASVLDLLAIRVALQKRASDAATSRKELINALVNLTKDVADVLVTMATVGYMKWAWSPGPVTAGSLTALSGAIATYQNWKKIK